MNSLDLEQKKNSAMIRAENQTERILTVEEVARLLRVHPTTISRYARSGELRSYVLGSRRLFKEADVWSFFENREDRECVFGKEN
jgi:excisionase family DNA binding protein